MFIYINSLLLNKVKIKKDNRIELQNNYLNVIFCSSMAQIFNYKSILINISYQTFVVVLPVNSFQLL